MNNVIKIGKVEKYIYEKLEEDKGLLFQVIDPLDYPTLDKAVNTAIAGAENGADAILIGGSIGVQGEVLDYVASHIKDKTNKPIILFPGNIGTVTKYADAIYFMSMLNARNPYWITQAQMLAAPFIKKVGIEPLPVGYIVIYPGGTVGWVGDANLVPREKPKIAVGLALAGEMLGNRFILTDVGSNPSLQNSGPVPPEMIRAVRSVIDVPYIVAGGIRSEKDIRIAVRSGADILQIGTAFEESSNIEKITKKFKEVIVEEAKRRNK